MLGFTKKQITNHFLEEIFCPADSKRLRSAAFEIQLSHSIWGSPFKCPTTACATTVSSLLRAYINNCLHHIGLFPNAVNDCLCKLLQNKNLFTFEGQILFTAYALLYKLISIFGAYFFKSSTKVI